MRSQRALVKRPEELSPGGIGWRIGVAVAIGIALVAVAFWLYQLGCPAATALSARSAPSWPERSVCGPIRSSPPWLLLSTLAASPAALLTWYWRTRHKERDLALAHDEQATARFVSAVQLLAKEADPVAVIGYPLGFDLPMDRVGQTPVAEPTLTAGMVSRILLDRVQVDGFGAPGSSGSPIFDRDGRVVAVLYGGERQSQGRIIYAVPAGFLTDFLGRLGVTR